MKNLDFKGSKTGKYNFTRKTRKDKGESKVVQLAKDLVEEDVKMPAISVPGSNTANITSLRPWYLIPADAVEKFTPFIAGMSGKLAGASGETFSILDIYHSTNKILDF